MNNSCPEKHSSFISQITFSWLGKIIRKGYKNALTPSDMWSLDYHNTTDYILKKFDRIWLPFIQTKKKSLKEITLLSPLLKTFWFELFIIFLIKLIASSVVFVNPLVLNRLINFVSPNNSEPEWRGYFYACLMFISSFFESLMTSQYEYRINLVAMKIRAVIVSVIYKKCLKLSNYGRKDFTTGGIVNLMSIDSQRIIDLLLIANIGWSGPFQIIVCLILLWQQLGIASLAGLFFMLALIPFNRYIGAKLQELQMLLLSVKDKRTKLMNEILNCIKVLKLYAWESSFVKQVIKYRSEEVRTLNAIAIYESPILFNFNSAHYYIGLLSFATFVLMSSDNILDANKAFVSLSLFNIMRVPLGYISQLISAFAMCFVSFKRIDKYLNADEINDSVSTNDENNKNAILFEHAYFSWSEDSLPCLNDISIEIKPNQLVAVVGQVGSGKTALLSAILGELVKSKGKLTVNGSIAYVPQEAWIQNKTLRDNIIFVKHFNENRYNRVIESCALTEDLKIFPSGDMTEIGENGINLSGGQKQRVSLARAVYTDSDIYLLDDPLSSVDTHVGRHIFERVIGPNGLLKDKTRILVTNRISILPNVDQIIVLKDGFVSECGTYEELISRKEHFSEIIAKYLSQESDSVLEKDALNTIKEEFISEDQSINEIEIKKRHISDEISNVLSDKNINTEEKCLKKFEEQNGELTKEEVSATGSVKLNVYSNYLSLFGIFFNTMIWVSYILGTVVQIIAGLWLSEWSNDSLDVNEVKDKNLRDIRLEVYSVIIIIESIVTLSANICVNFGGIRAAKMLHNLMMERVIKGSMDFFDTTPIGRILNRFSRDIDIIDTSLILNLRSVLLFCFRLIVFFTMISMGTPVMLVVTIPLIIIYYFLQRIYIPTSRQLKRIESTTRSPIFNHFSETVNGSTSIRAYGVCDQFIKESNNRVDANHMCYYPSFAVTRWLAIRLEFLGYSVIFLTAISVVIWRDSISAGLAGLALSYSLSMTGFLGWFIRSVSDLETNIVSVERCLEYTEIQTEAEYYNEKTKPNQNWPQKGEIIFNNYSTRYREGLDLVLKNISLKVKSGEKVGIVGRTGAGKSSLTLALFRLIEPVDGTIFIDNIDIMKLGLFDLRSRLTIIPQDPALFTGSLRLNLDPFCLYSDFQIWRALESAHLKSYVNSLEEGLSHKISEGGENLSVGQKQLVCLTRALLRKSRILVLDEATAAVDMSTDALIQETIRKEFGLSTIVTIAHRLNTIIDYDRVVVMDNGMVAEFDSPDNLLSDTNSIFYSMAKESNLLK